MLEEQKSEAPIMTIQQKVVKEKSKREFVEKKPSKKPIVNSSDKTSAKLFDLDSAGFLMIWVEEIQAYVHWLPVTKIEFEIFLSSASNNKFNDHWYEDILTLNERISPKNLDKRNYHKLFLTGVFPSEVLEFIYWLNENDKHNYYSIPTSDEWISTYKALSLFAPLVRFDALSEFSRRTYKVNVSKGQRSNTFIVPKL
ncbi:MAG: hypothetical protein IPL71_18990 [Anaerolineales bacterium]|uniref:hypothetical protein n=1 Tax=Candidatus Villigracilis proximus TaxID=3140683 RepID=UPI003137457E|nr:hypothetical protein [Anaerolineales bacterium]